VRCAAIPEAPIDRTENRLMNFARPR
jgi:hypothetical protein